MNLYFDNAATSFPKPSQVPEAMMMHIARIGGNPGRGAYSGALSANRLVYSTREAIADFFNFPKPENVIFTLNVTHAINILLKGIIKTGWHVITSTMEHNSVLRPLTSLKKSIAYELDVLPCDLEGKLDLEIFKKAIKSTTKLVILSQVSNVVGTIQQLEQIGNICKLKDIYFIIDGAQSCGSLSVDFNQLKCNALCFTGHKALLGPQGIGGFLIDDKLNEEACTFYEGGTGSSSSCLDQPDFLPDKFECGTLNTPAIVGLFEGIKFINSKGLLAIREEEEFLASYFIDKLLNIPNILLYGTSNGKKRTSVFSINHKKIPTDEFSFILNEEYNIINRSGLHCAPLSHETLGTFPQGTVRLSFGLFHEKKDIDYLINSICLTSNNY